MAMAPAIEVTKRQADELAEKSQKADEETPSTAVSGAGSECTNFAVGKDDMDGDMDDCIDLSAEDTEEDQTEEEEEEEEAPRQLQAGLFDEDLDHSRSATPPPSQPVGALSRQAPAVPVKAAEVPSHPSSSSSSKVFEAADDLPFRVDETLFIFDWDDTILPSTFLQRQGLRLDAGSQPTPQHRAILSEVAKTAIEIFNAARRCGTVVLITNAERGWIELSCQKFLPTLYPSLESVKLVSARTCFEGSSCVSPLEWKLRAFAVEIEKHFGADVLSDPDRRKNVLSLGDSVHEREAVMAATDYVPACLTKSLKFCERPDVAQICKQHHLILSNFEQIVQNQGNMDLCIRCP